ncbi:valine--tRNA ligase [Patescibacteria group bacterium]|nr:valine--tRNA ligase [Patescibacteria group bacterium]
MDKAYNPQKYENDIYDYWQESGFFNPDNLDLPKSAKNYTIVLPPPNVTDKLHMGHASIIAIEDLLIRYHRLKGYKALWLPGTDHAAIATQNVVEKRIYKERGETRHDLGREKFLQEVNNFALSTQKTIISQIKKMGASLDWSRLAFTLDDTRQKAVKEMFVRMYNEGVLYRGERVVNWCPRCHSTLADDEVEYKGQKANLYTFKYSKDFPFAISTTRPETKLGDTAIAVNPSDKRYKDYIGKTYKVNFVGIDLNIKVIADKNVDMNFGTGALGVTPAHSLIDWQMAQKEGLEMIKVIDEDAKIKDGFKNFSGLNVYEARKKIIDKLTDEGLILETEDINNNLSICYRCDSPIEPLPSKQWFINVDKKIPRLDNQSLKEKALAVIKTKEINFVPERFEKRYKDWMENLHDWCVSRQIWYGHRIPAWYRDDEVYVGREAPKEDGWKQDEDTLDTWFSSGMWTFSTLGWPEKANDLDLYHPTQVLETGYEIITLWVSRMIMMSYFALEEVPFENVYLHGMVLDKKGKKMSKSKGNGIDPVDIKEKYGSDSARLSLLIGNTAGNDLKLDEEKIASFRNFVNKIWNISRYIISFVDRVDLEKEKLNKKDFTISDKWIFSIFNELIKEVELDLSNYRFSQAGEKLRNFTWNDFADWYLEISKFEKNSQKQILLNYILDNLLKLWHPFMPFVSEAIYQELHKNKKMLMIAKWPEVDVDAGNFKKEIESMNLIKDIIIKIREARSINKVEPANKIKALIYGHKHFEQIKEQEHLIKNLKTGISDLDIQENGEDIKGEIKATVGEVEIFLIGAIDKEKEKNRREKEIKNLEKQVEFLNKQLQNKEFVDKAPEEVVKKQKDKLNQFKVELEKLKDIDF